MAGDRKVLPKRPLAAPVRFEPGKSISGKTKGPDNVPDKLLQELRAELARVGGQLEQERKARWSAEEALRQSREECRDLRSDLDSLKDVRLLAENMADVIWTVDMEMRLTFVTPSVKRLLGYTVEEAMAKSMEEVFAPESFRLAMSVLDQELKREELESGRLQRSRRLDLTLIRKDGSTVPVEINCSALRGTDGKVDALLAVMRDITDRKTMEQQLYLSRHLAALGELVAGAAHELNNPLAAIGMYAETLKEREDLDDTARNDIEIIHRQAQRAGRIIANLLSFARKNKAEKALVSVNRVLEEALELHARHLKVNKIQVIRDFSPGIPLTMADAHQMKQVFLNIIVNAQQAMTEAHGKGRLLVKTERTGGMIRIHFRDNGPGISEENLKRLFDPFFTTKEVGKGTGLGLSISYGIVREHGGHISAQSKPGKGATFVVEIPVTTENSP
ncbi:MAG: PAS domain S-box protein [Dehalococcoidia bacterium]|nr:PAS domain S-box protein [Dehalococcoidia bacterium]